MAQFFELLGSIPRLVSVDAEAQVLCEQLGLSAQADMREHPKLEEQFRNCLLSHDERIVWHAWCPTEYATPDELARYNHDHIPNAVLKHWAACKSAGFQDFSICTTEKNPPSWKDPILLGRLRGREYMLARWADESPDMLSFGAICETLRSRSVIEFERLCDLFSTHFFFKRKERGRVKAERHVRMFAYPTPFQNHLLMVTLEKLGYSPFTKET